MHIIRSGAAAALLLAVQAGLHAQTAPMQQVVVSADANALRAQSTTTSIVVGRDEILRHGDGTLSDVLKRQPGITVDASPGKAAAIRMRGMGGGYVALLLNGLPAPAGFALESLGPDVIERIEIQRTATAETSSQAVAGTINVILRRAGPVLGGAATEIKAGSDVVDGYLAPQLVAQHSGRAGALAYTLVATLRHNENPVTAVTTEAGSHPGLLRRIEPAGHPARFEGRVGDNHHHIVCRSCGTVVDVDCAVGEAPCLTPSEDSGLLDGFVLDEAEVIYWGYCPDCTAHHPSRPQP